MNDGNAKQQIVDKIKKSSNILVTVSNDPSVDELSAALGLTVLLNKMKKHATAVFSGAIPPAITFLDPEKTFENTVNSLRDFIIALDKEKADHLRYKVEGDVVKIFITPYRTTITDQDLEFSQGDYNVELVLALGVKKRENLDNALAAHGRILHDASVVTLSTDEVSELGNLDWREPNVSSFSEMLVGLADALKEDKGLLDEQIATAFLTGIVAATDRFSNNRTSSKVMTIAAQLMAAGANQQLIAAKLEDANEISTTQPAQSQQRTNTESSHADGTTDLSEGESTKLSRDGNANAILNLSEPKKDDGSLAISHEAEATIDTVAVETTAKQQTEAAKAAEDTLAQQLPTVVPMVPPQPALADLEQQLKAEADAPNIIPNPTSAISGAVPTDVWQSGSVPSTPSMGGTLNATAEQAADDQRKAEEADRNRTILTHSNGDYISDSQPKYQAPLNAANMPTDEASVPDVFSQGPNDSSAPANSTVADIEPDYIATEPHRSIPTLADIDEQNRQPHEEARAAVDAAFGAVPFTPANNPQENIGAQPLGDINHDASQPAAPTLPPLPDFSTLPPLPPLPDVAPQQSGAMPPEKLEDMFAPQAPTQDAPVSNDPKQFKIPGQ